MPRFPIAARDLVALMCQVGPVQYIAGIPSDLLVLTRYPNTLWLGTYLPWRAAVARLRAAGAIDSSPEGYLLPYIEQDQLSGRGYGYVRLGTFLFPDPPMRGIADGTSNTLLFGDGSVRIVSPNPSTGSSITDGTSNTILVGEQTPHTGGITGGFGDGSVRTVSPGTGSSITDGTSNTILVGEEDPGPPGTGSDTTVIVGGDQGVNHGPPRHTHHHRHVRFR